MSEAAKLLMKKAEEIEERSTAVYEATKKRAREAKDSDMKRVNALITSAMEICDHSEGTHEEYHERDNYTNHFCSICNRLLETD